MSNVVVAHEHYLSRGGAELVADELADCFDAPIVTGIQTDETHSHHDPHELVTGTLSRLGCRSQLYRQLTYSFVWEQADPLREYDVIIKSGNATQWYVPEQYQTIVVYNHSPPRQAFDLFDRSESSLVSRFYSKAIRQLWQNRTNEVDLWVCNSEVVAHRTRKYLGVPDDRIEVVYPPVDVGQYEPTDGHDGYYMVLSRLVPSKRIDLIIKAWDEIDAPLTIVGEGPHRADLEACATGMDQIEFTGNVSDERKRELLQNAKATLFAAQNEDFGIVPIESMAAGTSVLGVRDGYTKHQIKHEKNGRLFEPSVESIRDCVDVFEVKGVEWSADHLHEFSQQFSKERFCREMHEMVERAQQRNEIQTDLKEPIVI